MIVLRIAICHEDARQLRCTAELLGKEISTQPAEIEGFLSPRAMLEAATSGVYIPDVAIVHCRIDPEPDASFSEQVPLLRELAQQMPHCRFLLLAGTHGCGEGEVRQYLSRKKQREMQTMDAMKRMLRLGEERKQHTRIAARTGGKITAIPLGDVLYVERWGRKSRMVTVNGDYIASQHPEELLSGLEDAVVHCHQGYWVNLARIHSLAKNEFCLDDGSRIPISRTCRSQALTRFLAYIKGESTAHP